MTKNLKTDNSNDESYKIIERILNQKNKELKDLYKQNDYVIKPEFLEWQFFFSSFYSNKSIKGHSHTTGEYITKAKSVNLGSNIPDINVQKNIGNYELSKKEVNIPPFTIPEIKIQTPEIEKVDMNNPLPITVISFSFPSEDIYFPDNNNMSKTGEAETITSGNNYYENTSILAYNGNGGSTTEGGKDMSVFYLDNGKINNQNEINMEFSLPGSSSNFLGIYSDNTNKYVDFENNGIFTVTGEGYFSNPNILTTIGLGFGSGVESRNPDELTPEMFTSDPQKVILSDGSESQGVYIKNFGYAEL